jgi:hypothetical protein
MRETLGPLHNTVRMVLQAHRHDAKPLGEDKCIQLENEIRATGLFFDRYRDSQQAGRAHGRNDEALLQKTCRELESRHPTAFEPEAAALLLARDRPAGTESTI